MIGQLRRPDVGSEATSEIFVLFSSCTFDQMLSVCLTIDLCGAASFDSDLGDYGSSSFKLY